MKPIILFLLKFIANMFATIIIWCHLIIAFLLWDKKFLKVDYIISLIWGKPKD